MRKHCPFPSPKTQVSEKRKWLAISTLFLPLYYYFAPSLSFLKTEDA